MHPGQHGVMLVETTNQRLAQFGVLRDMRVKIRAQGDDERDVALTFSRLAQWERRPFWPGRRRWGDARR
jgi:hypothetical protein